MLNADYVGKGSDAESKRWLICYEAQCSMNRIYMLDCSENLTHLYRGLMTITESLPLPSLLKFELWGKRGILACRLGPQLFATLGAEHLTRTLSQFCPSPTPWLRGVDGVKSLPSKHCMQCALSVTSVTSSSRRLDIFTQTTHLNSSELTFSV